VSATLSGWGTSLSGKCSARRIGLALWSSGAVVLRFFEQINEIKMSIWPISNETISTSTKIQNSIMLCMMASEHDDACRSCSYCQGTLHFVGSSTHGCAYDILVGGFNVSEKYLSNWIISPSRDEK